MIEEMRAWVLDCVWVEDVEELAELSDAAVVAGVEGHYDGGVEGFLRDQS